MIEAIKKLGRVCAQMNDTVKNLLKIYKLANKEVISRMVEFITASYNKAVLG